MPDPDFKVFPAEWEQYKPQLREIRRQVFILEQKVPQELEWDDKDETALHVIAVDSKGEAIGTGRISRQGQIGRMAVLDGWRNRGVGSAILRHLLQIAGRAGLQTPYLNAQHSAISFYRRHGFVAAGDPFVEAGILHQRMQLEPEPESTTPSN